MKILLSLWQFVIDVIQIINYYITPFDKNNLIPHSFGKIVLLEISKIQHQQQSYYDRSIGRDEYNLI